MSSVFKGAAKVAVYVNNAGTTYREARFGAWGWWLYFFHLVDTDGAQENHWRINTWTDDEVIAWKNSYLANCNAITVAVCVLISTHQ